MPWQRCRSIRMRRSSLITIVVSSQLTDEQMGPCFPEQPGRWLMLRKEREKKENLEYGGETRDASTEKKDERPGSFS